MVALVAWFLFAGGGEREATDVNVEVPDVNAPEIDVPEEIDINVRGPGGSRQ